MFVDNGRSNIFSPELCHSSVPRRRCRRRAARECMFNASSIYTNTSMGVDNRLRVPTVRPTSACDGVVPRARKPASPFCSAPFSTFLFPSHLHLCTPVAIVLPPSLLCGQTFSPPDPLSNQTRSATVLAMWFRSRRPHLWRYTDLKLEDPPGPTGEKKTATSRRVGMPSPCCNRSKHSDHSGHSDRYEFPPYAVNNVSRFLMHCGPRLPSFFAGVTDRVVVPMVPRDVHHSLLDAPVCCPVVPLHFSSLPLDLSPLLSYPSNPLLVCIPPHPSAITSSRLSPHPLRACLYNAAVPAAV